MGNEQSCLSGLEIEEKSIEVSDFCSQHCANIVNDDNITSLTVFIGELFVDGTLWSSYTPLEKSSKHLMIYRHPCIVKYISSWQKSSKFYLALEEVKPLTHVLSSQNSLQVCIGLHSILKALCFLHDKALVSHNNVCTASVYVTKDGSWKLGGMEYLCKFSELSSDFLNKSKSNRYSKAIDANEEKHLTNTIRKDFIDIFAFGVLVCEVLKSKTDDEISALSSFRELAKNELQNVNVMQRPKLNSLLEHGYFNHDFILIHSFLVELPLKLDDEKTAFFLSLADKLRNFQETTVANQLGGLLLSRMVLLNKTAQTELLPCVLCPKQDPDDQTAGGLFSEDNFKKYLVPKLLEIFCVRDAQIRLLLLTHFPHFIQIFTKEELQTRILPELLVGIKDTNDHLVAVTLKILSDLVPILGATTVIGGKRAKLFNDGRPISHPDRKSRRNSKKPEAMPVSEDRSNTSVITPNSPQSLPERPRPDGEEVETSTEEVEQSVEEDLDNWEDWDVNEANTQLQTMNLNTETHIETPTDVTSIIEQNSLPTPVTMDQKKNLIDITELDIKCDTNNDRNNDEFDFFQDMEPVIEASSKYLIENQNDGLNNNNFSSKLSLNAHISHEEDGWVDEDWE